MMKNGGNTTGANLEKKIWDWGSCKISYTLTTLKTLLQKGAVFYLLTQLSNDIYCGIKIQNEKIYPATICDWDYIHID